MRKKEPTEERFVSVYEQDFIEVLIDRKTGVNYMVYADEHVTPLYDRDGNILVTPIPHDLPDMEG